MFIRLLKKLVIGLAAVLVSAVLIGATYQWLASRADRQKHPAPGRIFEVDGLALHLDCRGDGSPIVVLEAGLTSGGTSWALVHDSLAQQTRVCAYDRPGLDWSEPMGRSAGATEVADRLHELLSTAGIDGPQILVGMSAGGVYVREYFHRYPRDIVGMVLVDSSHEQQGLRLPKMTGSENMTAMLTLCVWLQPIGVIRAFGFLDALLDQYDLSQNVRELLSANMNQSHACSVIRDETGGFQADVNNPDPPRPLGDLPLTVLSQGKPPAANEQLGTTLEFATRTAVVWNQLQEELTALSSRSVRRIAQKSGHVIQFEQPDLVVSAITGQVAQYRAR